MKRFRLLPFFFLLVQYPEQLLAQAGSTVDSLERQLQSARTAKKGTGPDLNDSTSANLLLQLSRIYWGRNAGKAKSYADQSLHLSERIGFRKGEANALNSLATVYGMEGRFPEALPLYQKALQIRKSIRDLPGISATLNNLASIYSRIGKGPQAIQYYLQALKMDEALGDEVAISMDYGNMGSVYFYQGDYAKALRMFETSLEMERKRGNREMMARLFANIGNVYHHFNFSLAKENQEKAMQLYTALGDQMGMATVVLNLGNLYYKQRKFQEALEYQNRAYKLFEDLHNPLKTKELCNNLAYTHLYLGQHDQARIWINRSLQQSRSTNILQDISNDYQCLSLIDSAQGNFKEAFINRSLAVRYRDSVFNNESTRKITEQRMQFDFDKKETALKFEQQLTHEKLEKQTLLSTQQKQELGLKEQAIVIANTAKDLEHMRVLRIHTQKESQERLLTLSEKEKALQKEALKRTNTELSLQTLIRNIIGFGLLGLILVIVVVLRQRNRIAKEKKRSDQLVVEKEMLMKEIHHRVKNNLEVISSLLELQSNAMEEGKAKSAVLEGQSRVQSIALIHHKLYKTDEVAAVEFEPFVQDLYHQIESVFKKPGTEISFLVNAGKLSVSIDSAVPLGLILNELLTNSFKYGIFPDRKNEIQIDLQPGSGDGQYVLIYRDSGPGMPENFDMKKSVSLGMKVIGLLTRQLGGKLRFYNENGTVFEIPFHAG
ncbi:MAG TPA: tetratricopeptide repeat protein [Catalimonadaceae bacterium]|nr:tetratricopeptide repeat protein [Catalimonadaceae bacterium]HPI10942.1 tetratricopeptide repeat protein [Catalimonadaceae bacterium]